MGNQPRQTVARKIEAIARKLAVGYTDSEIMHELKMSTRTYYEYKHRVAEKYTDMARLNVSVESLQLDANLLIDRLTRLYRNLEISLNDCESVGEKGEVADVAAAIALTIFKVKGETFRVYQTRDIRQLEIKANRYIENIQQQRESGDISRVADTTSTNEPGGTGNITGSTG